MEPASPEGLFEKGLEAYQKKQFTEARDAFQKLLEAETASATPNVHVLHNLALSAVQTEQKPLALAAWRKALSLDPDFRPAQLGRDYLEKQTSMRPYERDSVSLWWRRTLEMFSIFHVLWLEALLIGSVGWLLIRYWSERRNALTAETPMPTVPVVGLLLAVLLLTNTALIGLKTQDLFTKRATVLVNKASIRSLPSDEGVSLFELNGGTELIVRRIHDNWLQVQSPEGSSGWLKSSDAMITSRH